MATDQPAAVRPPSLRRALFLGALLIAIDGLCLGQGAIVLLVGAWMLLVGMPLTFLVKRFASVRRQRLRDIAIYLTAAGLVFALNALNNRIARSRADTLVSAVKAFQAKNRRYPNMLDELVPEYIASVPLAKYTLAFNRFTYFNVKGYVALDFVQLPPFGRQSYNFERNQWGYFS